MVDAALQLVGGIDPSGGAGLLRDAWVVRELRGPLGFQAMVSMWTWQGDGRPARMLELDEAQLRRSFARIGSGVLKVGAIGPVGRVCLLEAIDQLPSPPRIVFDPVLRASDGGLLSRIDASMLKLMGRCEVLTPNFNEAQQLIGRSEADPDRLLQELTERFPTSAILLKGGHCVNMESRVADWFSIAGRIHRFSRNRCNGPDPRGTGCALASALACALMDGAAPLDAVGTAIGWLDAARQRLRRSRSGEWHLRIGGNRLRASGASLSADHADRPASPEMLRLRPITGKS